MAEEKGLMEPVKVRYKGFYDFRGLYTLLRTWLTTHDYQIHEKVFKEKPATHMGMETELDWDAVRKETPFIKYHIDFKMIYSDTEEIEVVKNGEKKPSNKGRVEIIMNPYLEYDWQGKYGTKFLKILLEILWKRILYNEWKKKYEDELMKQVTLLGEDVKKFLNMHAESGIYY